MKLSHTKTEPTTKSVLRFDEGEVVEALQMLAGKNGYKISRNGKCSVWFPHKPNDVTSLVIDADGNDFSIKDR
jgi:hypothetical protein